MKGIFLVNKTDGTKLPFQRLSDLAQHLKISTTTCFNLLTKRSTNPRGLLSTNYELIYMTPEENESHYPKKAKLWHCDACGKDYLIAKSLHITSKKHQRKTVVTSTGETPVNPHDDFSLIKKND